MSYRNLQLLRQEVMPVENLKTLPVIAPIFVLEAQLRQIHTVANTMQGLYLHDLRNMWAISGTTAPLPALSP